MTDLAFDTKQNVDIANICDAWILAQKGDNDYRDVSYLQVLSPFRGEYYGVDFLTSSTKIFSMVNRLRENR